MLKNKVLKQVLSGMLVLAFLLQPMSFQAQENLTKEATNVNILVQEPMNALFQQEAGEDATVENLEYSYCFNENKGEELTANVDVMIDMTVSGMVYEIEADGDVSGEKLSSGSVLWMGPLEGLIEINNIEYLVMVGFVKMDELVQISVTIQSKDDKNVIEPVRVSFGDNVITEDIYQEIIENKDTVEAEPQQTRSRAGSTYIMNSRSILNQPQLEGGSGSSAEFQLKGVKYAYFSNSLIPGYAQTLYGYYDKNTKRVMISLKTYCSNLEKYYSGIGYAYSEIENMEYTLQRGNGAKMYIAGIESFDFNIKQSGAHSLIMGLFADAISFLKYNIPTVTITEVLSGVYGTVNVYDCANSYVVNIKFGTLDSANFDDITCGMPIVFQLATENSGFTQDFTLKTSITYRTMVKVNGSMGYAVCYESAQTATCGMNINVN